MRQQMVALKDKAKCSRRSAFSASVQRRDVPPRHLDKCRWSVYPAPPEDMPISVDFPEPETLTTPSPPPPAWICRGDIFQHRQFALLRRGSMTHIAQFSVMPSWRRSPAFADDHLIARFQTFNHFHVCGRCCSPMTTSRSMFFAVTQQRHFITIAAPPVRQARREE